MNMDFDNAQDDRDALEKHLPDVDPLTCPIPPGDRWNGTAGGPTPPEFDPETGVLPWDGGGIKDGRIVSIEGLDRMGDHLVAYERGLAQAKRLHDAAVKRLEERLERVSAPLRREVAHIRAMVEAFAQEQGRKGICIGRLKSRTLPSGLTLAWRERKTGEYRWDQSKTPAQNRDLLLQWARIEQLEGRVANMDDPLVKPGPDLPDKARIVEYLEAIVADNHEPRQTPPGLEYVPLGETLIIGVETKEDP